MNRWTGVWGILQIALLQTTLKGVSSITVSLVAWLGLSLTVALGLDTLICISAFGVGNDLTDLGWITLADVSQQASSMALVQALYMPMPTSFKPSGSALGSGRRTALSSFAEASGVSLGIAWAFRILGFMSLLTGITAALLIRERIPVHATPGIDWTLLKNPPFACLSAAGAIVSFSLYVPSFFHPLAATLLDCRARQLRQSWPHLMPTLLSADWGWPSCVTIWGPQTLFSLIMVLNAATMLTIWTASDILPLLMVFVALNSVANGAFFVAFPAAVGLLD
ncbi:putative Major facilitator superfamily domain-containing protein [Seiridium cardinale]